MLVPAQNLCSVSRHYNVNMSATHSAERKTTTAIEQRSNRQLIAAVPVAATASAAARNTKSYTVLRVEQRQHILAITFNRPAVRNALDRRAYYELIRALRYARHADDITIVVLTGAGGNFSAGIDLTQTRNHTNVQAHYRTANPVLRALIAAFIYCPKLLVALVDGACIGVGFTLCALCDIVYCTERAYFMAPFTRLGLCPEACSTHLLPLLLGRSKSSELLLFGERLSAQEALNFKFVARIVPVAELESSVWPKLAAYSRLPWESLRTTKRLLRCAEEQQLLQALQRECKELTRLRLGKAHQEALAAFMQQHPARAANTNLNKSKL